MADNSKTKGPKPERVKLSNDWMSSLSQALKKNKPKDGWPKQPPPLRGSGAKKWKWGVYQYTLALSLSRPHLRG